MGCRRGNYLPCSSPVGEELIVSAEAECVKRAGHEGTPDGPRRHVKVQFRRVRCLDVRIAEVTGDVHDKCQGGGRRREVVTGDGKWNDLLLLRHPDPRARSRAALRAFCQSREDFSWIKLENKMDSGPAG